MNLVFYKANCVESQNLCVVEVCDIYFTTAFQIMTLERCLCSKGGQ